MTLKKIVLKLFFLCMLSINLPTYCMEQDPSDESTNLTWDMIVEQVIQLGLTNHALIQSLFDKDNKPIITLLALPNETLFYIFTLIIYDIFNFTMNTDNAVKSSLKSIAQIVQVNKRFYKFYKDLLRYQKSWIARKFAEETLFYATRNNNQELIVALFLPNFLEAFKENSLFKDCIGLNEVLLNNGLNINARDKEGNTALMWSIKLEHDDLVTFLSNFTISKPGNFNLNIKANIDTPEINGQTPLMVASLKGNADVVTFLLENHANIHAKDIYGQNALMWAILNDETGQEILRILLKYGANINDIDENGNTALMRTSKYANRIRLIRDILAANAKVNIKNKAGYTALSLASKHGRKRYIKLLLENDANSNTRGKDGDTPLLLAAEGGHKNAIVILLNSDANINARNLKGNTALIIATIKKHADIVQLLLEHKADTSIKNNDNFTANEIAIANNDTQMIKLFANSLEQTS